MVRSRRFCCCLPVRFGVLCMSIFWLLAGGLVGGVGWHEVTQLKEHPLDTQNKIALYIQTILYTLLAIVSIFGFLGAIIRKRSFVSAYSTLLWTHLGFSVSTGAFYLYTLFHQEADQDLQNCISATNKNGGNPDPQLTKNVCSKGLAVLRGIVVGVLVIMWLIEFYGCIIVGNYVEQLDEEENENWTKTSRATQASAAPPPMATYQQQQPYTFSTSENAQSNGKYYV